MPKQRTDTFVGMQKLSSAAWPEVWRRWKKDEGALTKWRQHFRRQGYATWAEWRQAVVVQPFGLRRRRWALYQVTDPGVVPTWFGGPHPRWVTGPYKGAQTRSFTWLAASGRTSEEKKKITSKPLPKQTFMFGLIYRGNIYILDGMHRCTEIAARVRRGQLIPAKITIALAQVNTLPKVKQVLI